MLVWIDLETTGLDPLKDCILEVGAVVTDDDFNEVAQYRNVTWYAPARDIANVFAGMRERGVQPDTAEYNTEIQRLASETSLSEYVLKMHDTNGLWRDCSQVWRPSIATVDHELCEFICKHAHSAVVEGSTTTQVLPQLAGSTISFDRGFMRGRSSTGALNESLKALHYRNVDVSTLNELARRHWQALYASRPNNESKAHRGMADVEESIRVLKHYMKYLVPAVLP